MPAFAHGLAGTIRGDARDQEKFGPHLPVLQRGRYQSVDMSVKSCDTPLMSGLGESAVTVLLEPSGAPSEELGRARGEFFRSRASLPGLTPSQGEYRTGAT